MKKSIKLKFLVISLFLFLPNIVCGDTIIVNDTFERNVTDSWGTADVGGDWNNDGTQFDVNGTTGYGEIVPTSGSAHYLAWIYDSNVTDSDINITVYSSVVAARRTHVASRVNSIDIDEHYCGRMSPGAPDYAEIQVSLANGTHYLISRTAIVANTPQRVRFRTENTTLKLNVWNLTDDEPGWKVEVSDANFTTGRFGVGAIDGASGTLHEVDNFTVTEIQASAAIDDSQVIMIM